MQASVHELLELALHAPPEPLPARAALEQAFHLPLGDVVVHRGPAAAAALARLHAPAAVYAGEMLLGILSGVTPASPVILTSELVVRKSA